LSQRLGNGCGPICLCPKLSVCAPKWVSNSPNSCESAPILLLSCFVVLLVNFVLLVVYTFLIIESNLKLIISIFLFKERIK
jgi:hypothetical protein